MGISGLWKLLNKTMQTRTLTQLAVSEGFEINHRGEGTIYLGLDASLLLNRAQWAAYHQKGRGINMQAGENLPLQILFFQICRFVALPVKIVFVFDGPNRPANKRGRKVKAIPHALMGAYTQLIKDAGFHAYTAPGEAEAELSQLNLKGEIDAVLTDDADAFLFGAIRVIRPSNVVKSGDHVSIYSFEAIQNDAATQLTLPRMLLMAILSGGDYAKGLKGCGPRISHALSTGTSLGEDLYTAAQHLSHRKLLNFLQGWRDSLRYHLKNDPNQIIGRCYPSLARNISCDFPSCDVLAHYVRPATSWSDGGNGPDISWLGAKEADLPSLAVWCEKYFSWGTNGNILERFSNTLWRGICIRSLMKPVNTAAAIAAYLSNNVFNTSVPRPIILRIYRASLGPGLRRRDLTCGATVSRSNPIRSWWIHYLALRRKSVKPPNCSLGEL
ncbi:PIN domain-like protein [Lyophyllum atratum]|nr:PIN domain-like protein [Lyophyllum atratum]